MQASEILLQRPSSIGLEEARAQGRVRSVPCEKSGTLVTALLRLTSETNLDTKFMEIILAFSASLKARAFSTHVLHHAAG
jgi:hypothetical protein